MHIVKTHQCLGLLSWNLSNPECSSPSITPNFEHITNKYLVSVKLINPFTSFKVNLEFPTNTECQDSTPFGSFHGCLEASFKVLQLKLPN